MGYKNPPRRVYFCINRTHALRRVPRAHRFVGEVGRGQSKRGRVPLELERYMVHQQRQTKGCVFFQRHDAHLVVARHFKGLHCDWPGARTLADQTQDAKKPTLAN
jgi:hypothetical protein